MSLLFDLDAEPDACFGGFGADSVDEAFGLIKDHIVGLEPRAALARIGRYESQLAALKTSVVAKLNIDTGSDREAKRLLNDGKTSRRTIAKAAKRGDVAAKNKALIDKMAAGGLSEEQVDVIADTSAKTDGAAATDDDFINAVASVDPDLAQGIAEKYIADKADPDGVETERKRQRRLRRALKYFAKKNGLDTIVFEGDSVAAKNMWTKIMARANQIYQADGGRDIAGSKHPRTYDQCLFDAAYELICDVTTTPTGCSQQPRNQTRHGSGRPQIFVGLTLDKYLGLDPSALGEQIGLGAIPDSVLADYLEHADILGVLYDRNSEPLWVGRTKRHATIMQRYALIARDKACVLCNADHHICDVHHRMPWNAPDKGETNLNNLVLLCPSCHRTLHANNHTLHQDHKHIWRTRPATPNETPPAQHNHPQRK